MIMCLAIGHKLTTSILDTILVVKVVRWRPLPHSYSDDHYHTILVANFHLRPDPYPQRSAGAQLMMDRGGDGTVPGPDTKQEKLPEVPLRWTDFMWALEKLRHKPYSKKTRERWKEKYKLWETAWILISLFIDCTTRKLWYTFVRDCILILF